WTGTRAIASRQRKKMREASISWFCACCNLASASAMRLCGVEARSACLSLCGIGLSSSCGCQLHARRFDKLFQDLMEISLLLASHFTLDGGERQNHFLPLRGLQIAT